ncbi:uncharacterized protein TNCV_493791 [Trichonephila clavipes]|nr:uncharacterized protein TNCV_493791 [Trichonephila clavipes]
MDGKGLELPGFAIDDIAKHALFLILSLPNHDMMKTSPFAIHKALIGIGGEPKSIKRLRSPHKSLDSSCGVISEPDLLSTPEEEILEGFSDQDSKLCPKRKLEKQIQEIKTNKNISYFEAHKLIVPQPSQTYAEITKPTVISTTSQTDPSITKTICPPLQCLSPIISTSSSMPAVSTSSSSSQTHLLPSTSAEIPTIQSKSLLPIPIPTTTPNNNLNTSASSLETETRPLTTSNKFTALQPSVPLSEFATTTLIANFLIHLKSSRM